MRNRGTECLGCVAEGRQPVSTGARARGPGLCLHRCMASFPDVLSLQSQVEATCLSPVGSQRAAPSRHLLGGFPLLPRVVGTGEGGVGVCDC